MKTDLAAEERLSLRGLVLREYDGRGANRTLEVLTAERGLLRVQAYGSGKSRSALAGATQTFTYSDFSFLVRKNVWRVEEAAAVVQFRGLTRDFERFALAAYAAEALCDCVPAGLPAPEPLQLALYALRTLEQGRQPTELVRAAFTLRLLSMTGFEPNLAGEGQCFLPGEGRFAGRGIAMTEGARAAMRHIVTAPVPRVFSFTLGEESLRALAEAAEKYAAHCWEHGSQTLEYYKRLRDAGKTPSAEVPGETETSPAT